MFAIADLATPPEMPLLSIQRVGKGQVAKRTLGSDLAQQYFVYIPDNATEGASVLVSVHGISRNAMAHVRAFAPFADRYGVVIVAPLFSEERFRGYQRLGISSRGDGRRPDLTLHAILAETAVLTGAHTDRVYLFGYSGGGQFAHRYAMAYPERVLAVAMGAPGWYTFPETQGRYPRGLDIPVRGDLPRLTPSTFLRVPMAVFVGEHDNLRDAALKKSRCVDAQQGLTRIERGQRWVNAMRAAAAEYGYITRYEYRMLTNCGHSLRRCMRQGEMGWRIFEFLFDASVGRGSYRQSTHTMSSSFLIFNAA